MAQYAPIDPTQMDETSRVYGGNRENFQGNPEEDAKKKKAFADMMAQVGQQMGQTDTSDAPMQQLQGVVQQQRPFEMPQQMTARQMPLMPSRRNVMGF